MNNSNPNNIIKNPQLSDKETVPKKKISLKLLLLILIGVLVLSIIAVLIFFFSLSLPKTISDDQLFQGTSVNLKEGREIKFKIENEEHKSVVDSIGESSVDITIQNKSLNTTLSIGETKKFDLDNNGTYDILIKLNNITDEKADLYVKRVEELICIEEWTCTEWTSCTNEIKTRTCTDSNNCGTIKDKPDETQECRVLIQPIETNCSEPKETNIDCFIDSAATCKIAKLTYGFTRNTLGWVQTNSYYYEIYGTVGGKCELYHKILSTSGVYSDVKRQSLLDGGNSGEDINESKEYKNEFLTNITGKSGICRYSSYELKNMLTGLKKTGAILPIENPETYQCGGYLYENISREDFYIMDL